ncbi:uncharacterized protein FIBRA_08201 [Fibroporia radiculosa]|uniref:Uncharacterized protein n=1 Tax=Fibroporia radiculosa TaxID=599839 RepID=J4I2C9_9APHY|nr:uncharacterized protein FIBRA_08201 [Fibroporia radiculosa]CCM05962.1 predicted protein [Fibroporia radiculosa]
MTTLPLRINLSGGGGSQPIGQQNPIFDILNDYLQPSSILSLKEATEKLDRCCPLRRPDRDSAKERSEQEAEVERFLWGMWEHILIVATQVPYRHPSQDKLAGLISSLKNIPSDTVVKLWGTNMRIWQDLPMLGPNMREDLDVFNPKSHEGDAQAQERWQSYNAFVARLFRDRTFDTPLYALWMLRDILEDIGTRQDPISLDAGLPVAAEWIFVAGSILYDFCHSPDKHEPITHDIARAACGGRNYHGPPGLSLERWQFWKERFAYIQIHEPVEEETKHLAREAVEAMKKIERRQKSGYKG